MWFFGIFDPNPAVAEQDNLGKRPFFGGQAADSNRVVPKADGRQTSRRTDEEPLLTIHDRWTMGHDPFWPRL